MLFSLIVPASCYFFGFSQKEKMGEHDYTECKSKSDSLSMNTELENILISTNKAGMISYLKNHPEDFESAINLAVTHKQPYSWRAASLLWSCMENNDARIQKHVKRILEALLNADDGHQRELLKILMNMKLKKEYESILFDKCMTTWEMINKQPSVRFTAFKFILHLSKKYPELSREINYLTQDQYLKTLSPAARKSFLKMIINYKTDLNSLDK